MVYEIDISPVPAQTVDLDLSSSVEAEIGAAPPVAVASALARAPVVTSQRHVVTPAVRAASTGFALLPTVVGAFGAGSTVLPPYVVEQARAFAPVVTAGCTVFAVKAVGTATSSGPLVAGFGDAGVSARVSTTNQQAIAPVVSVGINATVQAVIAVGVGLAPPPINLQPASVNAVVAKTNAALPEQGIPPEVSGEAVLTGGGPGLSSALAIPPVVSASASSIPQLGSVGVQVTATNAGPISVPVPSGMASGQVAMACIFVDGTAVTVTPPAGFTEAADSPAVVTGIKPLTLHMYTKRATGNDTGTYNFAVSGSVYYRAVAVRFSNVVATGTIAAVTTSAVKITDTDGLTPAVSDTTSINDSLWVWAGAGYSGGQCSPPAGFTEIFDPVTGNAGSMAIATKEQVVPGTSGSLVGTWGTAASTAAWLGAIAGGGPTFASIGARLTGASGLTTANIPVPPGVTGAADEVIVAFLAFGSANAPTTTISGPPGGTGWFNVSGSPAPVPYGPVGTGQSSGLGVYWKRASGVESGTYNFTSSAPMDMRAAYAVRYTNCTAAPTVPIAVSMSPIGTNTTAYPDSVLTTTGNNQLVVWAGASIDGSGGVTGGACSPPAGYTVRANSNVDFTVTIVDKPQPLAGSTGVLTASATGGTTGKGVLLLALK